MYQRLGQQLLEGLASSETMVYSPVYGAAYAVLHLLQPARGAALQDLMGVLVVCASSLALWWTLRACLPRSASVLGAIWWGSSLLVLATSLRVYLFTAVLTTLAVGLACRGRSTRSLGVLALAAVNRQELLPWLLGAAALLCVSAWLRRERGRAMRAAAMLVLGVALLLMPVPGRQERQWFTFRWYYTVHFAPPDSVSQGAGQQVTAADAIVWQTFPGCMSVKDAWSVNPRAVMQHVGRNVSLLPEQIIHQVAHPWFHLPVLRATALGLASAMLLVGLALWWRARKIRPAPGDLLASQLLAAHRTTAAIVMLTSLLPLLPLAFFLPRPDYLLPLASPLFILLGLPIARAGAALCARLRCGPNVIGRLVFAGVVALVVAVPGPFVWPPRVPCANRDAVALIARQNFASDVHLVASTPQGLLTLANARGVPVAMSALLGGQFAPAVSAPCYLLLGLWDLNVPQGARLVAEAASDRWSLIDAGNECWLFLWRG